MNTKTIIKNMMLENTGKAMGDSGDYYGRNYEKNQTNGISDKPTPIDFYLDEEEKTISLSQTVNIYDFLPKHLSKTDTAKAIENILYDRVKFDNECIYSIWYLQDLFKNDFLTDYYIAKEEEYSDEFYEYGYCGHIEESLMPLDWINTYNHEEYVSQTLQFLIFSNGYDDFILLQIHGGCDVRGGYTKPQVFQIEDVEYFLMYMDTSYTYCECGLNDLSLQGYDITNSDGTFLTSSDIYQQCYVDKENNLRCKKCNSIILEYSPDF